MKSLYNKLPGKFIANDNSDCLTFPAQSSYLNLHPNLLAGKYCNNFI